MEVVVNGEPREIEVDATIENLIESLKLQPRHVAVELNLQLVPRGEHGTRRLSAGDKLEVVTLVGGG